MLLFGRKIANIKYVERNAIESFNQAVITTRLTRGRKASAENVNDHSRLCIKCALKLKHGAVEKISYISSDNFIFKARKRNDYAPVN